MDRRSSSTNSTQEAQLEPSLSLTRFIDCVVHWSTQHVTLSQNGLRLYIGTFSHNPLSHNIWTHVHWAKMATEPPCRREDARAHIHTRRKTWAWHLFLFTCTTHWHHARWHSSWFLVACPCSSPSLGAPHTAPYCGPATAEGQSRRIVPSWRLEAPPQGSPAEKCKIVFNCPARLFLIS